MIQNKFSSEKNWYALEAPENDVIVSVRMRLARNLANFPFVTNFKHDDAQRVQVLVYDAFSKLKNAEDFHFLNIAELDSVSTGILTEQGYLKMFRKTDGSFIPAATGIFINTKGEISCAINCMDHLHLSAFGAGLSIRETYAKCQEIDLELQNSVQFSASCQFGYLTSSLLSCGTGIKMTARVHLPGVFYNNKIQELKNLLAEYKLKIVPAFGTGPLVENAFGKYFHISNSTALKGSEIDQIANFEAALKHICDYERKNLAELADNKKTINRHNVIQAYSLAKFSLFMNFPQALNLISDLQFGLKLGIISGIKETDIYRLIYHVQNSHLEFLLKNETFDFEEDIKNDHRLIQDRLRAMIVQEAIENIILGKL